MIAHNEHKGKTQLLNSQLVNKPLHDSIANILGYNAYHILLHIIHHVLFVFGRLYIHVFIYLFNNLFI